MKTTKSMLFYNPGERSYRDIAKKLREKHIEHELLDATSSGISPYLYRDLLITKLPALYTLSRHKYRVYEGRKKIEAYLAKMP